MVLIVGVAKPRGVEHRRDVKEHVRISARVQNLLTLDSKVPVGHGHLGVDRAEARLEGHCHREVVGHEARTLVEVVAVHVARRLVGVVQRELVNRGELRTVQLAALSRRRLPHGDGRIEELFAIAHGERTDLALNIAAEDFLEMRVVLGPGSVLADVAASGQPNVVSANLSELVHKIETGVRRDVVLGAGRIFDAPVVGGHIVTAIHNSNGRVPVWLHKETVVDPRIHGIRLLHAVVLGVDRVRLSCTGP
mmetsp:Transcript_64046/g.176954  ORF Transcript_64046/g.176954 Transcript_64046/m.176954 type:complete len:250 (+) Transcript_64046:1495-2244(+)